MAASFVRHTVDSKSNEFKTKLNPEEQKIIKTCAIIAIPVTVKIPFYYFYKHDVGDEAILDVLRYNSVICSSNNLSRELEGEKIPNLQVFSVRYSEKFNPPSREIFQPSNTHRVNLPSKELIIDPRGDNAFRYIYHLQNGYINVSYLSGKYHTIIDFDTWERRNSELINKYCDITKLNRDQIIIKSEGRDTYVLPGLCINFMLDIAPKYGNLMKKMFDIFVKLPATAR